MSLLITDKYLYRTLILLVIFVPIVLDRCDNNNKQVISTTHTNSQNAQYLDTPSAVLQV